MDKQPIPEKIKQAWCARCFGSGRISHSHGMRKCDDCDGRKTVPVLYWKPKKNWIKKPLDV